MDSVADDLFAHWKRIFRKPQYEKMGRDLIAVYSAPDRHYHNVRHIQDCLELCRECAVYLRHSHPVETAIWFHDAVYDPTRSDNEERSADLAETSFRDMAAPADFIRTIRALILDTRHATPPASPDGRFLVDIDLSILGRPAEVFDLYGRAIRQEYAHVPDEAYRVGRTKVLQSFLDRPFIYNTDFFRSQFQEQARENLTRAIDQLKREPRA